MNSLRKDRIYSYPALIGGVLYTNFTVYFIVFCLKMCYAFIYQKGENQEMDFYGFLAKAGTSVILSTPIFCLTGYKIREEN